MHNQPKSLRVSSSSAAEQELDTHLFMMEQCAELVEIYKQEDNKELYQQFLNGQVEEKIQSLALFIQENDSKGFYTYYSKKELNDKALQFVEKLNTPDVERLKLFMLVNGPSEFIIRFLSKHQSDKLASVNFVCKGSKTQIFYPWQESQEEKDKQFNRNYLRVYDPLFECLDIEQEIYDVNQELYNCESLREAKELIAKVISKVKVHVSEYGYKGEEFWGTWCEGAMFTLKDQKKKKVSQLIELSVGIFDINKILFLVFALVACTCISYLVFLILRDILGDSYYYGHCAMTDHNLKSIAKIAKHIRGNRTSVSVYGSIDFVTFHSRALIVPVYANIYRIFTSTCMDVQIIAQLPSAKAIARRVFWEETFRLSNIFFSLYTISFFVFDTYFYNRLSGICE